MSPKFAKNVTISFKNHGSLLRRIQMSKRVTEIFSNSNINKSLVSFCPILIFPGVFLNGV